MALQGTIEDFALPDIFQLIGIQRKTGILTLNHEKDSVTIKFLEGQVVEADTASESLEDRLGSVLVRTGKITQPQLDEALQVQTTTLQRLGHILVKCGYISTEDLVDALMVQSSQVIYRLFRWRQGSYNFDAVEDLDYDQNHSTPISSETILMEGARMVDEWPLIERRIPKDSIVLLKTEAAEGVNLDLAEQGTDSADDDEFEIDFSLDHELAAEGTGQAAENAPDEPKEEQTGIQLSNDERLVLRLVDGKRTVREIADLLPLQEFETFRMLSDMMVRRLLEKVQQQDGAKRAARHSGVASKLGILLAKAVIGLAAGLALIGIPSNSWGPLSSLEASRTTEQLRLLAARPN